MKEIRNRFCLDNTEIGNKILEILDIYYNNLVVSTNNKIIPNISITHYSSSIKYCFYISEYNIFDISYNNLKNDSKITICSCFQTVSKYDEINIDELEKNIDKIVSKQSIGTLIKNLEYLNRDKK